ncbi:MAG TPA: hypothetical protein GXZ89_01630, partial [Fastidiosipila sp.]|nr:hypothetical protein [Fastidiosipila sp.]
TAPTPAPTAKPTSEQTSALKYPEYPANYLVRYIEGYVDEPGFLGERLGFYSFDAANQYGYAKFDQMMDQGYNHFMTRTLELNDRTVGVGLI